MCKCLQYCLESCYWHLIEKRFCYDESIALYEVPEKEEKNNNFFDNLAFYDSVSVIAGRAIVTIDPLPEEKPIVQQPQPTRRLRFHIEDIDGSDEEIRSIPRILEPEEVQEVKNDNETKEDKPPDNSPLNLEKDDKPKLATLKPENLEQEPEVRRKSLKERRLSKSLYLKIVDQPKEIPIIRQQSMPKFFLDTPDDQAQTSMFRTPSVALTSPVPKSSAFVYDLYSVVQMERERVQHQNPNVQVPIHRKESDRSSRLLQIRDKIKLRRVKSNLGTPITNLPHSHHHI